MATKKKAYESKAIVNKITATSRISLKINETFYTLEYSEERLIPDIEEVDIEKEREILWDVVNAEVDKQAEDIKRIYRK
jgi:hypothetical protein